MNDIPAFLHWYEDVRRADPVLANFAGAWVLLMESRIARGTRPSPHLFASTMIFAGQLVGEEPRAGRLDSAAFIIVRAWRHGEAFGDWFTSAAADR